MNDEDHTYQIRIIALSGDLNVIFFFLQVMVKKKNVRFHFSFNCLKISPEKIEVVVINSLSIEKAA